jgi:C-terminal processing protease CtpA/Prc
MRRTTVRNRYVLLLVAGLAVLSLGVVAQAGPSSAEAEGGQGYIGIVMQNLTDDIAKGLGLNTSRGVLVADVVDGSPAEEAGIEDGDVILEFDGKRVRTPESLRDMVRGSRVGEKVRVKVIREDETKTLTLVVGSREREVKEEKYSIKIPEGLKNLPNNVMAFIDPGRRLGVAVADLNDDLAAYFDVGKDDGVLVLNVEKESVAMAAGIKPGDIIKRIGDDKVDSVAELKDAVREMEPGEDFDIAVSRHGSAMTLTGSFEKRDASNIYLKEYSSQGGHPMKYMMGRENEEMNDLRVEMQQLKMEMKKLKEELKRELKDREED